MAQKPWSIPRDTFLAHIILLRTFAVQLVISKRMCGSLVFAIALTR